MQSIYNEQAVLPILKRLVKETLIVSGKDKERFSKLLSTSLLNFPSIGFIGLTDIPTNSPHITPTVKLLAERLWMSPEDEEAGIQEMTERLLKFTETDKALGLSQKTPEEARERAERFYRENGEMNDRIPKWLAQAGWRLKKDLPSNLDSITLSERTLVGDPCYLKDLEKEGESEWVTTVETLPGEWVVTVTYRTGDYWCPLVLSEVVFHHSSFSSPPKNEAWKLLSDSLLVDSGNVGVFNSEGESAQKVMRIAIEDWSGYCNSVDTVHRTNCFKNEEGDDWQLFKSGFGDGVYSLFGVTDKNGKVTAMRLEFFKEFSGEEDE